MTPKELPQTARFPEDISFLTLACPQQRTDFLLQLLCYFVEEEAVEGGVTLVSQDMWEEGLFLVCFWEAPHPSCL